jgi:uncharacterized protein YecE (DUF72 family)
MDKLFVGTSGWVYKGWAGSFYPAELGAAKRLGFYSTQFSTVEINATFYRLPTQNMVRGWHQQAPEGFIYAVKGSRFITHIKRLKVLKKNILRFFTRVAPLKEHLGPILWQLPPTLQKDLERLDGFVQKLPPDYRYALEFRHPSWNDDEVVQFLKEKQIAWVSVSSMRMPMNLAITSDFIYLRFHGLESGAAHDYTRAELQPWAEHCRTALRKGLTVYAYFNNDWNVRAPKNAKELISLVTT